MMMLSIRWLSRLSDLLWLCPEARRLDTPAAPPPYGSLILPEKSVPNKLGNQRLRSGRSAGIEQQMTARLTSTAVHT